MRRVIQNILSRESVGDILDVVSKLLEDITTISLHQSSLYQRRWTINIYLFTSFILYASFVSIPSLLSLLCYIPACLSDIFSFSFCLLSQPISPSLSNNSLFVGQATSFCDLCYLSIKHPDYFGSELYLSSVSVFCSILSVSHLY